MKIVSLIALTCLGATTAYAQDVNETLDAAADGVVQVSNVAGSVESRVGRGTRSR